MLRVLGDDAVGETVFNPEDREFENIIQTTWTDLCDEKWVEKAEAPGHYRLTGLGWLQALRITGQIREEEFRERLSRTFASMKSYVKGRKGPAVVKRGELAKKAGVPEGWLFNVIESRLIEEVHGRKGPHWDRHMVFIPADFDMVPLELTSLLVNTAESRIEELQAELEEARERLNQFLCPYCGAALSASGPVPLSEHDEGYFETFECGYSRIDGFEQRLCPSDPKFPTLDEFELKTVQRGNEWFCHAVPQTANALKIDLSIESGNTEEEAKQRVIKRYKYVKGELKWNQMWPFA
ncbi:MAG: hypothetical protein HYS38_04510 [Acidobacteria bacterium]|nr:hypothetical protein [Acidobacteriota bacterium]